MSFSIPARWPLSRYNTILLRMGEREFVKRMRLIGLGRLMPDSIKVILSHMVKEGTVHFHMIRRDGLKAGNRFGSGGSAKADGEVFGVLAETG